MTPAVAEPESGALPMDNPPAAAPKHRVNHVVERKLGELDARLDEALSHRPRRSDVDGSLFDEIRLRIDFIRTLIAAEAECHGGARPDHLAEAEARFAVLESAFQHWARGGGVAAAAEIEKAAAGLAGPRSACSCTESCFGLDCAGPEVTAADVKCGAEARKAAATEVAPTTMVITSRRCWWRKCFALCGAAGVVAVVAIGVGLAAVAHRSVCIVPT